jgi:hypothetical protein
VLAQIRIFHSISFSVNLYVIYICVLRSIDVFILHSVVYNTVPELMIGYLTNTYNR